MSEGLRRRMAHDDLVSGRRDGLGQVGGQPSSSSTSSASKRNEARRCFGLARSLSGVPIDRPFMVAIGGPIGSGKSTLAAELGRELAVPVVSSDRTRKATAGVSSMARADPSSYTTEARNHTYEEVDPSRR